MRVKRYRGSHSSPSPSVKRKALALSTAAALALGLNLTLPAGVLADDAPDTGDDVVATAVEGEDTAEVTQPVEDPAPAPEVVEEEAPEASAPAEDPVTEPAPEAPAPEKPAEEAPPAPAAPAPAPEAEPADMAPAALQCKVTEHTQFANIRGQYVNGNLNGNNSAYAEGDWVARKLVINLSEAGTGTVTVQIDKMVGGKYAFDNLRVTSGADIVAINDDGATMTYVLDFTAPAGDHTIYFQTHIASELDYGPGMGAGSINGSPYHARLMDLSCGNVGQMDRSMKTSAVTAGKITVVKDADPADGTKFNFSIENNFGKANFKLADGEKVTYRVAPGKTYVGEDAMAPWDLTKIVCTDGNWTQEFPGPRAMLNVRNGADWTCTFFNEKQPPAVEDIVVEKTAETSYVVDYPWDVEKTVDRDKATVGLGETAEFIYKIVVKPGDPVISDVKTTGKISITNPNKDKVKITGITDSVDNGGMCTIVDAPEWVGGGDTVTVDYTCTYPDGKVPADGVNTVKVDWEAMPGTAVDPVSATAPVKFTEADVTEHNKTVLVWDSLQPFHPEWTLTWGDPNNKYELEYPITVTPDETFELGVCVPGINTVELFGDSKKVPIAKDEAAIEVCVEADLAAVKSVNPSFTRTYDWDIDKHVVKDSVKIDPKTGKGMADYKVHVTPGDFKDSHFKLDGTIALSNVNAWDVEYTLTDTFVSDGKEVTCHIDGKESVSGTLAAGSADKPTVAEFEYSCTFGEDWVGKDGDKNTVTVTWGDGSTKTTEFPVAWDKPTSEMYKEITVTDYFNGDMEGVSLTKEGPLMWRDSGEPYALMYTGHFQIDPGTCAVVKNLVKIDGTDWKASTADEWCVAGPGKPPIKHPEKPAPTLPVTGEDSALLTTLALMGMLGGALALATVRKRHA